MSSSITGDDRIEFTTFILSLSSSALIGMGEIPNPLTGQIEKDFCAARETIQIIEILSEKTMGNLTSEERGLMDSVLIDLRIKYVSCAKKCNCTE